MDIKYRIRFGDIARNLTEITEISQLLADAVNNKISNGDIPAYNEFTINLLNKKVTRLNIKYSNLLEDYYYKISQQ